MPFMYLGFLHSCIIICIVKLMFGGESYVRALLDVAFPASSAFFGIPCLIGLI